jgi:hypothetical protein
MTLRIGVTFWVLILWTSPSISQEPPITPSDIIGTWCGDFGNIIKAREFTDGGMISNVYYDPATLTKITDGSVYPGTWTLLPNNLLKLDYSFGHIEYLQQLKLLPDRRTMYFAGSKWCRCDPGRPVRCDE